MDGQEIIVKCNEAIYAQPIETGTVLTIKYDAIDKNGKFVYNHNFPFYMRKRDDMTWDQITEMRKSERRPRN